MKKYFNGLSGVLLLFTTAAHLSCSKMDAYKKYESGGEIVYPGIFDSLKVIPGKNRALITGILLSDPKVTKFRVFWNGGLDSVEAPLVRTGGVDTLKQIVDNLPEGPITFEIRTYDDAGNKSIPMSVTGDVYGENFQNSINLRGNRGILQSMLALDGSVQLTWADEESYVGVVGMHIQYYDVHRILHDTIVAAQLQDQVTDIPEVDINKPITYNTLFIPDAVGIDTLTVQSSDAPQASEVALLNNIHPVKVAESDGNRWATLADWISNDAVKNHNGYGGSDISGGTDYKIFFEAGYGAPEIANGKIYQVATLPPGKYTFDGSIDWWNNGGQNYTYIVVAPGANGLPDTDNLNTALGYQVVNGGWDVTFSFELTQQTTVSIGCLLNLGTSGNSMRFNSLRLYINH